jgi:hypothetical protein
MPAAPSCNSRDVQLGCITRFIGVEASFLECVTVAGILCSRTVGCAVPYFGNLPDLTTVRLPETGWDYVRLENQSKIAGKTLLAAVRHLAFSTRAGSMPRSSAPGRGEFE